MATKTKTKETKNVITTNIEIIDEIRKEVQEEVSVRKIKNISEISLLKQVVEFKKIEAVEKLLSAAKKEIKAELIALLKQAKVDAYQIQEFKINYSEFERDTFDTESFKEIHKILYKRFLKTSKSTKFEIR